MGVIAAYFEGNGRPMGDKTLLRVLTDAAHEAPEQVIVHVRGDGSELTVTLRELLDASLRVAGGFLAAGVAPGTCVPLLADRSEDFQPMFWGALAAGLVPVPLAPDARRVLPVCELLGWPPVVVDAVTESLLPELPDTVRALRLGALREGPAIRTPAAAGPDDLAFLQFSSGSTGAPKGVELTHAAVVANLEQIRAASALDAEDVVVSWMPYFHDMGLIGTHLAPLAARAKQVKIGPLSFAKRPLVWFDVAARHRATVLSAANFALALAVRRVPDEALARLDLSRVRLILVGAEPIAATVWRDFARKTRPAGLDPRAAQPVYGLAEATLAVTFPPLGEVAGPLVVERAALSRGLVVDAAPDAPAVEQVELMDVGRPVAGCAVRIVDDEGLPLGDRRVGHIEVRGPQLARGYHRLPEATAEAFADGWLRTGDLGFLRDGRLCVSGRHKDVLFLNGRTFHAPDLEDVVSATPGLPGGAAAVVGSTDPVTGGERVVVFVPWARPPRAAAEVLGRVAARVREALLHDDVRVLALPPAAFPRTTSGKLQRQRLRVRFEAGAYPAGAYPASDAAVSLRAAVAPEPSARPSQPGHPHADAPRAAVPRSRPETERVVRGVWARVLDLPVAAIGRHDRFGALGGTSLKAMEVLAALEEAFATTPAPAAMRDHDTVAALVDHLLTTGGTPTTAPTTSAADTAHTPDEAQQPDEPVNAPPTTAIIGMACRFPGADTPEAFWELLADGHEAVTAVPSGRWDAADDQRHAPAAPYSARWGAFLDDPAGFDAEYFGIDEEEARAIDPQARLFLELAHEALERAGYAGPRRRARRIGVFAAVGESGYREILDRAAADGSALPVSALTGNLPNLIAARVSQSLDLDGPALAVDTACSSGLVALHLARRSLLDGECDIAVVGGVNLHLTPTGYRLLEGAQALSPTGRSRAFSGAADGFVPGEGGAAIVLTRLGDARRDDDHVLAVVRGTAVNNDGRSLSLMAPNPLRQREVITRAYQEAGVDPASVTYVEAHGTGTAVGDPIELQSLAHAFAPRADGQPRLLGSVKTNFGHLLNAAAMPALLKVVLALGHGRLPASLHHTSSSPGPGSAGFAVVTELRDWESTGPLTAGINAFGFGGTNAHAILEQAPTPPPRTARDGGGPHLLTLSARSAAGLRACVSGLATELRNHPQWDEGDVCLTASTSRDDGPYRLAVVADGDLPARLDEVNVVGILPGASEDTLASTPVEPTAGTVVPTPADDAVATTPAEPTAGTLATTPAEPTAGTVAPAQAGPTADIVATTQVDGTFAVTPVEPIVATGDHTGPSAGFPAAPGRAVRRDVIPGAFAGAVGRSRPRVVFLFPGQGAPHHPGQGRSLYATAPVFRDTFNEASALLGPVHGRDLVAWCLDDDADPAARASTEVAQPLLVTFGVALARQLRSWGVEPDAVAGHSVGEIAAACVSGTLTLEDAVRFAAERGRLMGEFTEPGAMVAVRGGDEAVAALVAASEGTLGIAARNGPGRLVLSGAERAVARAVGELTAQGITVRPLRVSRAFHSPLMRPIADPLADAARALALRTPSVPLMSTATAEWQPLLDPEYLRGHALQPVLFGAAVERLIEDGYDTFVELGQGATLSGPVRAAAGGRAMAIPALPAIPDGVAGGAGAPGVRDGRRALLETVGRLWARGVPVDRTAIDAGHHRLPLPPYPFQRRRYWAEPPTNPLLHQVTWEHSPLPDASGTAGSVLLTGPDAASVRTLTEQLAARGVTVHRTGDAPPDTVVLLAGPACDLDTPAALDLAQDTALTACREALALLDETRAGRLLLLTEDVHTTRAAPERPRPAQAVLIGLALALPQETPGLTVTGVDLSSLDTPSERLDAVLAELGAGGAPGADGTVAWRAGRRLTRTFTPIPAVAVPPGPTALPADGTYLITGGGGGIGAALARDLAGRGRPTLVLAGRSPEPPAGLVDELGALGATVRYHVADLSVERDVDALIALIAQLPSLDAVFHAAGVVRPGTLRNKTPEEMTRVLAAKTRGSRLLSLALRRHGVNPAVCVAFSSISSVLPGVSGALGDYAAANAFLDAFAASERLAGRPWQSLNFAAFAETGLAAALGAGPARVSQGGARPLATAPALAALRTACDIDAAQLLVADLTPARTAPVPAPERTAPVPEPAGVEPLVRDHRLTPGTAGLLKQSLGAALHRSPASIPDDEPFFSMGLDSLTAVDLVRQLEQALGRTLPTTLFFEYRTVRELAVRLDDSPATEGRGDRVSPEPAPDGALFPLTPVQLAFHTSGRLHPDISAHGYVRLTIRGHLDTGLLGQALAALADRHTMLRMRIEHGGATPRQYVAPPSALSTWYEVRESAGSIEQFEAALCNRPFDLAAEPPVRAVLARESADLAHLVLVIHHAAGDGYSLNVLGEELWSLYTALSRGDEPSLPPLDLDFARYAATVEEDRSSAASEADRRYWSERLATPAGQLRLPYDGDPTAPPSAPLATHQSALDPELTEALRERAAAHDVSLFHLLLAAYVRCLARWSGQHEITVNIARARRDARLPGLDRLVGPLADTLPVRCEADPDEPVPVLAERLRRNWLESERHATVTSLDLARLLPGDNRGPRTASPASFSFARFPAARDERCPVAVRPTAAGTATAATRLSLLCWEDEPILRFSWNFPARLFDPATVARLAREYQDELVALGRSQPPLPAPLPARASLPLPARSALPLPAARQETGFATIVGQLLAQFRATPDAVAVDSGGTTLTYAELDRASRALADRLRAHGVTPGCLVGLLTEAGADTVVGVVAVLRAGAGWVPLDPGHPSARLADQIARSGVSAVVCHAPTRAAADALPGVAPVPADGPAPTTQAEGPGEPVHADIPVDADTIAYVIFTSGSTGRPKAVPITYRAMENYLDWALRTFGYAAGDRLAQTASICFDASVRQLLAPLLVGATVVTVPWHLVRDPDLLLTHVERARITVWSSVPTLWERLLTAAEERVRRGSPRPDLSALRWIHVGGEALSAAYVRRWFDLFGDGQRIANLYGPTEATINATCHLITERPGDEVRRLPIGRPLTGTEVDVVGPDGERLSPGEPGELLIAGIGLTPGYLGEPALTAAAFTTRNGRRWYRSGDRVQLCPDGTLEFLGRLDDQVKIRGHRVEPGEIEAVLQTHPDVAHAVVSLREDRLVAFVTCRPGAPRPDAVALRLHCAGVLPQYMLPARITHVDELPLTGTGKIDRRGLLASRADGSASREGDGSASQGADGPVSRGTDGSSAGGADVSVHHGADGSVPRAEASTAASRRTPPATPTELRLARIWSALLQVAEICREDDFFALGGDSLLVLEVFARLEKQGGPLPRPTVIYAHRTLTALAAAVDAAAEDPDAAAADDRATGTGRADADTAVGAGPSPFPVTPGQRGFLLAEAIAPGAGSAWLARLRLSGPLRTDRFQAAVDVLVARHPMLRTVFPAGARPPVQQELPPAMRLPVDFETLAEPHLLDERVDAERRRRFEPWAWPLLRVRVLTLAADEHVLVVHAHHLIGDGYSAALLVRELMSVYDRLTRGEPAGLPPLRSTFRDYAAHLTRPAEDRPARTFAPYRMPVLRADASAVPEEAGGFRTTGFVIGAAQVEQLRTLASGAGATSYAPLLTAYYRALVAVTGQKDLVLGLAVTGRDHSLPDVNRVFGPFATVVPVRPSGPDAAAGSPAPDAAGFAADLRRVVADAVTARTYDGPVPRQASGLPLTSQFFFTFLDFSALGPQSGETLKVTWDESDSEFTPPPVGTDVFMAVRPDGDRLRVTVRASTAAFSAAALAAFADSVRSGLAQAVARPEPSRTASQRVAQNSPHHEERMDAALVGYLPSPTHLARLAGLPARALPREELRTLLFPDGRARLLETVTTPLGRSGFVCVPLFADELTAGDTLLGHTTRAVRHASSLGARSVSLAGMIPSLTGYAFDVLRATPATGTAAVTTGHAATIVSVVKTVRAALDATGQEFSDLTVAVVGLGSIGASSLELLLTQARRPPARLLLCDVAGSAPRLKELARSLRERALASAVDVVESEAGLPAAVYEADLVVTAVSGGALLDIDRLRPGTTVVDDSFPHCFDTDRAIGRMKDRQDVLVVGGGLLAVGDAERRVVDGLSAVATAGYLAQPWLAGTLASCRLESLLHASGAAVPLVHGLVDGDTALAYWEAMEKAGVRAAPLHLLGHTVDTAALTGFPRRRPRPGLRGRSST
ncbi:amino acid adenylation domain-containing protein [Streptomyces sp. NPDC000410]|uniref:non-ribosomal peptide synthetase/type I polyketide synthase n=1 Tax=Streptomyces sp. NPDC000410 TaxID=3154254 RepID=UPI0033291FAB